MKRPCNLIIANKTCQYYIITSIEIVGLIIKISGQLHYPFFANSAPQMGDWGDIVETRLLYRVLIWTRLSKS